MVAFTTLSALRKGELRGIRRLDLEGLGLTEVPPEVFGLADTLEVLNISGNALTQLPEELPRLSRLKVIFCSSNPLSDLPEVLGDCPSLEMVGFKSCGLLRVSKAALPRNLRWLTLTDNAITALPECLGEQSGLQKLMLAGNRLTALPESLAEAKNLELLRLSGNDLARFPAWLLKMPRLAWLALSGNPFVSPPNADSKQCLPVVHWRDLQLGALLGEGASGHIYQARRSTDSDEWALKLFKGQMTSDGLPEHEWAACVAAGPHEHLCTPVAKLVGHPEARAGMLMPRVPVGFVPLAGPPSLQSCTRDVYAPGFQISSEQAGSLLIGVAKAVKHLHDQGVLHGDLYAHNTLWHAESGQALLSDLGAATVISGFPRAAQNALLAQEVLAFGHMMTEVLDRIEGGEVAMPELTALTRACSSLDAATRPPVAAVLDHLARTIPHL